MKCSICEEYFLSIDLLIIHLKKTHFIRPNDVIACGELDCPSTFSSLVVYKRHIIKKHRGSSNEKNASTSAKKVRHDAFFEDVQNDSSSDINKSIELNFYADHNTDSMVDRDEVELALNSQHINENNDNSPTTYSNLNCNIEMIKMKIDVLATTFLSQLYGNVSLTSSVIKLIIDGVSSMLDSIKNTITPEICSMVDDHDTKEIIEQILYFSMTPFTSLKTEYLFQKNLKKKELLGQFSEFNIENKVGSKVHKGIPRLSKTSKTGIIMPIHFQIKRFFENTNLLDDTLEHIQKLENTPSNVIFNIVQGIEWKRKREIYPEKLLIPYFLYHDDFETGNALSSRAGKQALAAFYYSFPCLPNNLSNLDTTFVAMLLKADNLKQLGNRICLQRLIDVVKTLEIDGIVFKKDCQEVTVHFIMVLILGDNLGLNLILGFARSFSHILFCRFCKVMKCNIHTNRNNAAEIRTIINYNQDIKRTYKETGIFQNSPLNSIPSFHVVLNYSVDAMHDLFEGVVKFGLVLSLKYFVYEKKYFTLETLNRRIQHFDYGPININSRPAIIKMKHIMNKNLILTASQSMCLINIILLLIVDFLPGNDKKLNYLQVLQELVEKVMMDEFSEIDITNLERVIILHNTIFYNLFGHLKPKHHLLEHYPMVIKQSGPPRLYWSMKFESKHKQLKAYANVSHSRINLSSSLGKKLSYNFSYLLQNNFKSLMNISEVEITSNESIEPYRRYLDFPFSENEILKQLCSVKWRGRSYNIGYYIYFENHLCKIKMIFLLENDKIYLMVQKIKIIEYNIKFRAYETNNEEEMKFFGLLLNHKIVRPFHLHTLPSGKVMFRPNLL